MMMARLPDGNFATTPVYVGVRITPERCSECQWQTKSSRSCEDEAECPEGMKYMHFQVCRICGWMRVLLTPTL